METIIDFHLHSKYSRCCSRSLELVNIEKWCEYKGIGVVGTADFIFPAWNYDLNTLLEQDGGGGLYKIKGSSSKVRFILSTEISLIYKQAGKCRRVHICILAPSLVAVNKIRDKLGSLGNIKSDGRPILGISCRDLAEIALEADERCLIIPAHIWTPWFSMFGSKSGFDSVEECFADMSSYIYGVETGLSSSVLMNWMVSDLDRMVLLSNSDAHSLENLGREANVFELNSSSYDEIYDIFKSHRIEKFKYSINFFPQEGKYHLDGCSKCGLRMEPEETQKNKGVCPSCKREITVGVLSRVYCLADRKYGQKPDKAVPYKSIVPLREIISEALGKGKNTKTVNKEYFAMVKKYPEFQILLDLAEVELLKISSSKIVEGVMRVRRGEVVVLGGYDGIFGTVKVWAEDKKNLQRQFFL